MIVDISLPAEMLAGDRVDAVITLRNDGPTLVEAEATASLTGVLTPLHPGAERFYREAGLIEE